MIIVINDDPIVWFLRGSDNKININPIINNIKDPEYNTNDYYSAINQKSVLLNDSCTLKEEFIKQIAYPVYGINIEEFNKLDKEIFYYRKSETLMNEGNANGAQICVIKAGYKNKKDLKRRYDAYYEIYDDINDKYNQFLKAINDKHLNTLDSSLQARTNESNQLSKNIYINNHSEHLQLCLDKLSVNAKNLDRIVEVVKRDETEIANTNELLQETQDNIDIINNNLKSKVSEREDYEANIAKNKSHNALLKEDLDAAEAVKIKDENDIKEFTELKELYSNYYNIIETCKNNFDNIKTNLFEEEYVIDNTIIELLNNQINDIKEHISIERILNEVVILEEEYNNLNAAINDESDKETIEVYISNIITHLSTLLQLFSSQTAIEENRIKETEILLNLDTEKYGKWLVKYNESNDKIASLQNSRDEVQKEINTLTNNLKTNTDRKESFLAQRKEQIEKLNTDTESLKELDYIFSSNNRLVEVMTDIDTFMRDLQQRANDNREDTAKEVALAKKLEQINTEFLLRLDQLIEDPNRKPGCVKALVDEFYAKSPFEEMLKLKTIRMYV